MYHIPELVGSEDGNLITKDYNGFTTISSVNSNGTLGKRQFVPYMYALWLCRWANTQFRNRQCFIVSGDTTEGRESFNVVLANDCKVNYDGQSMSDFYDQLAAAPIWAKLNLPKRSPVLAPTLKPTTEPTPDHYGDW